MTDQKQAAAPPARAPGAVSPQQVQEAMGAAFEVLNGAPTTRVLEIAEKIAVAKLVLRELANGQLAIVRPAIPAQPAPENRAARRRDAAAARRASRSGK